MRVHTPIWGWDQDAIAWIACVVKERVETACSTRCSCKVRDFDWYIWVEVFVQEACKSFQDFRKASKCLRVREVLGAKLRWNGNSANVEQFGPEKPILGRCKINVRIVQYASLFQCRFNFGHDLTHIRPASGREPVVWTLHVDHHRVQGDGRNVLRS